MVRDNMTTRQAADYLGVSARTLGNYWHRWGLTPAQVGKHHIYRKADLDRYLADHIKTQPNRHFAA